MLDELGVMRPVLQKAFARLQGVPTDIEPVFATADELAPEPAAQAAQPAKRAKRSHAAKTAR